MVAGVVDVFVGPVDVAGIRVLVQVRTMCHGLPQQLAVLKCDADCRLERAELVVARLATSL